MSAAARPPEGGASSLAEGPRAADIPVQAFYGGSTAVRWLGRGLRLVRRWAPSLSVRAAQRLFFTPLPTKRLARARPAPPGWLMEALPFEQGRIAVWRHRDNDGHRPPVLLVHGWAGDAWQLRSLAEALHAAGLAPVLVDLPGHGRADGWHSTLPQFVRALFAVQARLGPWQAVVAHSLGALAAAHAAGQGLALRRLVLIAPSMPPAPVIDGFGQAFGLGRVGAQQLREAIERHEGVPLAAFEPAWLAPRLAQPTLIVHDEDDAAAPIVHARRLAAALPASQWLATRGLGHRRVLRDAEVVRRVTAFVTPATAAA